MSNYTKQYYLKNREKLLAKRKQYCIDNPELVKQQQHDCYIRNKGNKLFKAN